MTEGCAPGCPVWDLEDFALGHCVSGEPCPLLDCGVRVATPGDFGHPGEEGV